MSARLTASEKHSLTTYLDWKEWGKRFGFRLHGTNDEHEGHFRLEDGSNFIVPKLAREAIDRAQTKG